MCIVLSYDWKKIGWTLSFFIHYTVEECRGIKREVSTLCAYGKTCFLAQHSTLWCTQTRKGHLDYYRVLSPFFVTWQNLIWYFFFISYGNYFCHLLWEKLSNSTPFINIYTPGRTLSISGLKSRVLKSLFFNLKNDDERWSRFFLKSTEPLQRYLLTCQANSAHLGRFFYTGQQQLWSSKVQNKKI